MQIFSVCRAIHCSHLFLKPCEKYATAFLTLSNLKFWHFSCTLSISFLFLFTNYDNIINKQKFK